MRRPKRSKIFHDVMKDGRRGTSTRTQSSEAANRFTALFILCHGCIPNGPKEKKQRPSSALKREECFISQLLHLLPVGTDGDKLETHQREELPVTSSISKRRFYLSLIQSKYNLCGL